MANNPYAAPRSRVADNHEQTGETKFWSFSGRLGRIRYLAYGIAAALVGMAIIFALLLLVGGFAALSGSNEMSPAVLLIIIPFYIVMIVISFMLAIQRCHDFNVSGWLSLIMLIPLGSLVFMFVPGTKGTNNYGPPPPPNSAGVLVLFWLFIAGMLILPIMAAISIPAYMQYMEQAQSQQDHPPEDIQQQLQQLQEEMQQQEQQQGGTVQPNTQPPQQ